MKKAWQHAIGITLVLLVSVGAIYFFLTREFHQAEDLVKKSAKLVGRPAKEVVDHLGSPELTFTYDLYMHRRRDDIADSYEPDPPAMKCDRVMQYSEFMTLVLLFVKDEVVIEAYYGQT